MRQPVEKVNGVGEWTNRQSHSDKEKGPVEALLINLLMFCPAATIKPSMFTFSKPLNLNRPNR
jgi:hypothetical protein